MSENDTYFFDGKTDEEIQKELDNLCIKTPEDALKLIIDVANDYDNCKSVKTLKELVDELAYYAKFGLWIGRLI